MTRSVGARNKDYLAKRRELAGRLRERLVAGDGKRPSYAELAAAAGVSLATLRHYFGDREAAVATVLTLHGGEGEPYLQVLRKPSGQFAQSIRDAADFVALGLSQPEVAQLHAAGLTEGIAHDGAGPTYLREVLEPLILALEERLQAHIDAGEMRLVEPRTAVLALIAPLFIGHLHQQWLGGAAFRPLDTDRHRAEHVEGFIRAYAI